MSAVHPAQIFFQLIAPLLLKLASKEVILHVVPGKEVQSILP